MSLFDEMLEVIEPQARARGITVTRQVPAAVPLVSADRARLAQVLSNLVTNALKFTSAGGSVSIRARRLDGVLQISVEDSGAGIPQRICLMCLTAIGGPTLHHRPAQG